MTQPWDTGDRPYPFPWKKPNVCSCPEPSEQTFSSRDAIEEAVMRLLKSAKEEKANMAQLIFGYTSFRIVLFSECPYAKGSISYHDWVQKTSIVIEGDMDSPTTGRCDDFYWTNLQEKIFTVYKRRPLYEALIEGNIIKGWDSGGHFQNSQLLSKLNLTWKNTIEGQE